VYIHILFKTLILSDN